MNLNWINKEFPNFPQTGTFANRIHDAGLYQGSLDSLLYETILKIFGADDNDPTTWTCNDICTDWYDNSLELVGCIDSLKEATPEQQKAIFDLGFSRFWLNWGEKGSPEHREKYYYKEE